MRLKRLRLSGFKSFCDDTEFCFGADGINVVLGPNGCGKSNVVDAIRWALGEQSPRQLRGATMEDVIFGGSTARKPIGRCEVTLTFDNTQGLALEKYRDFSEIEVTRRLYRSGESEYVINGMSCRLLDIRELVMDTGIAGRAYSIVEQGQVERFITSSPAERRVFVEEAAGIVRYRTRRATAERKLEQTDQNLLRVNDLVMELKRQEAALRGQVDKAREYAALKEEVTVLSTELALARYRKSEREFRRIEEQRGEAATEHTHQEQTAQLIEVQWERLQSDQAVLEGKLSGLRGEAGEKQQEAHRLESQAALGRQNEQNTRVWIRELEERLNEADDKAAALARERERSGEESGALGTEEEALREAMAGEARHFAEQDAAAAEAEVAHQALQEQLLECHTELTGNSNQQRFLVERREEWTRRGDALEKTLAAAREELAAAESRLTGQRNELTVLQQALAGHDARDEELATAFSERERVRTELAQRLDEAEREERAVRSRLEALAEIDARHEGLEEPVRAVLEWADAAPGGRAKLGVLGPLAEFIDVDAEHIEWAGPFLAPFLELLVVRRSADVPAIEAAIADQGLGRVRMIPLDALARNNGNGNSRSEPAGGGKGAWDKGDAGFAGLVRLPEELEPLRDVLFGDVRLLPQGTAPYPMPEPGPGCTQWLERSGRFHLDYRGVVAMGQSAEPALGILRRRGEIEAAEKSLGELAQAAAGLREELHRTEAETAELAEQRQALQQARQADALQQHALDQRCVHAEQEGERLARSRDTLEAEHGQIARDLEAAQQQRAELLRAETALRERLSGSERELATARERSAELRAEAARLGERLTERKVALERILSRLEHLRERAALLDGEEDALAAKRAECEEELARQHEQLDAHRTAVEEATAGLARLHKAQEAIRRDLNQHVQRHEEGEQQRVALAGRLKAAQTAREQAQAKLHEMETALAVERTRMEQAVEQLGEAPPEAAGRAEMDEAELEARWKERQERLERMGGVNLAAPEEHGALQERMDFLQVQKSDLDLACEDLKESIRRMNQESRKRFKETFDQVNETFQRVFPEVFGGGEGRLVLTDSEDLLLAGVDIEAQPPGKKLQTLSLLSGGEKALCAIALIFSFFLIKPSPFCLLDEVDAPLDDANVGRFNRMVQSMTDRTQFIIITHNRRTMESGNLLFGITMEEAGVSKVVSVNLSDPSG